MYNRQLDTFIVAADSGSFSKAANDIKKQDLTPLLWYHCRKEFLCWKIYLH